MVFADFALQNLCQIRIETKILSRVTEPTEGYAEIQGRVGSLLEVGTGFHPELTGRENIYLNGAILGSIGASVIELGVSLFYVRPSLFLKSSIPLRGLWSFAAPLFMSALSLRFFRLDLFALKVLGGTAAQAGFYSAAFNLSTPPALLSISLSPPLISTLSRLMKDGHTSEAKEIASAALSSVFWLLPFGAVAAGASPDIVELVFGRDFSTAAPIFAFLIFAAVALHAVNVAIAILTASNHPKWSFTLTGPMVPIALLGHILLIPPLGGLGAALVTTFVACLSAVISVLAVYRTLGPPS